MTLEQVLRAPAAARIADVVERMQALDAALPRADGIACFNRLYLAVTEAVVEAARPGVFADPPFVRWLDVVFANLYFEALANHVRGRGRVPRAWRALFEARSRRGILPIQFALAGMNAHINRDLPLALVSTCRSRRIEPGAAARSTPTSAGSTRCSQRPRNVSRRSCRAGSSASPTRRLDGSTTCSRCGTSARRDERRGRTPRRSGRSTESRSSGHGSSSRSTERSGSRAAACSGPCVELAAVARSGVEMSAHGDRRARPDERREGATGIGLRPRSARIQLRRGPGRGR